MNRLVFVRSGRELLRGADALAAFDQVRADREQHDRELSEGGASDV